MATITGFLYVEASLDSPVWQSRMVLHFMKCSWLGRMAWESLRAYEVVAVNMLLASNDVR